MTQARLWHECRPLALIASLLFNANRDPKKTKALSPEDMNPYDTHQKQSHTDQALPATNKESWAMFKQAVEAGAFGG